VESLSTVELSRTGADIQGIDMSSSRSSYGILASLILAALASRVFVSVVAQEPAPAPETFRTAARFSVDSDVLRLRTAVAFAEPHERLTTFSWVRIYFYGFDLTAADVSGLSRGTTDGLERRRMQPSPGRPDMNHSRAALHFLLDKDSKLSNASLEVPGLTCTIVVEASTAAAAVQTFRFDGRQLQVKARGATVCDLTAIKGGTRPISWDVDVNIPAFAGR
jgi:hypothetical protein